MPALCLPAPAKLNLFLHVLGRRADGYHRLQTLFQLLDVGDELELRPAADGQLHLHCDRPELAGPDNLVLRAAAALRAASGCDAGAQLTLRKRLPVGGGIGGGSSDAATTLLGLNRLWGLDWSLAQLAAIGVDLGADIPVFIHGRSAWAEGVGEQLTPVELPPAHYLVLAPAVAVSTAEIFADPDLTRDTAAIKIAAFFEGGGHNDCQPVVERRYPEVAEVRRWLEQFAPARLTGTGACVFARFDSAQAAHAVFAQRPSPWQGFVASGVNRSPLHERLHLTS